MENAPSIPDRHSPASDVRTEWGSQRHRRLRTGDPGCWGEKNAGWKWRKKRKVVVECGAYGQRHKTEGKLKNAEKTLDENVQMRATTSQNAMKQVAGLVEGGCRRRRLSLRVALGNWKVCSCDQCTSGGSHGNGWTRSWVRTDDRLLQGILRDSRWPIYKEFMWRKLVVMSKKKWRKRMQCGVLCEVSNWEVVSAMQSLTVLIRSGVYSWCSCDSGVTGGTCLAAECCKIYFEKFCSSVEPATGTEMHGNEGSVLRLDVFPVAHP